MHFLDFVSESPRNFIFQKEANKTNLGGVISFLYLFILIIISSGYLYDYYKNDKYEVKYSSIRQFNINSTSIKDNPEINPIIQFKYELYDFHHNKLSERFRLYDLNNEIFIDRDSFTKTKVSDLKVAIVYKCEDTIEDCELNEDDVSVVGYIAKLSYTGFRLLHQNDTIPLQNNKSIFTDSHLFFYSIPLFNIYKWEVVKYKEIKGIFSRLFNKLINNPEENKYIGGHIVSSNLYPIDETFIKRYIKSQTDYKILSYIFVDNSYEKYIQYERKKIEITDVIGNICSFIPLLNFCFCTLIFRFYSKNFDNYKIIEKIIDINKKNIQHIELTYNNLSLTNSNNIKKLNNEKKLNNDISNSFSNNTSNRQELIINDYIDDDLNDEKNELVDNFTSYNITKKFPKFNFIQFYLNNIYFKCCGKCEKQEFISACNQILYKYLSIDYILYSLIKLENLFKDYKWNNPELNNIENNELIIKLKRI